MVYRIFVEKKKELANEAKALLSDAKTLLGIKGLSDIRIFNRYDAENITEELFDYAVGTVFSEPQLDIASSTIDVQDATVFAVEFLPGQFDQRADSAAQCIQIISQGDRPLIRSAKVYALYGDLSAQDIAEIKKYVINPVEAREASMELPDTLETIYEIPTEVAQIKNFRFKTDEELQEMIDELGLAMDLGQKHKIHLEVSFGETQGGKWCRENCWRFGFILRYDETWEEITGYKYEPWHFRYVGKEFAKEIHEANVPLETWLIEHRAEVLKKLVSEDAGSLKEDPSIPLPATPSDL